MTSTPNLGIAHFQQNTVEPDVVVNNMADMLDEAHNNIKQWTISGNTSATQAQLAEAYTHRLAGAPGGAFTFYIPATISRRLGFINASGQTATIRVAGNIGSAVTVNNGDTAEIHSNGTDVYALGGTAGAAPQIVPLGFALSDETTPISTGTAKLTVRMPFAFTLSAVRASLNVAQTSGSIVTVDINQNGVSILSTKLTIDNNEKTSVSAAAPAVISDTTLDDDAEITFDIDQIGNGTAAGLKVWFIGTRT